jgi:hypothetical protein
MAGEQWWHDCIPQGENAASDFHCGPYIYYLDFVYETYEYYEMANHYAIILAYDIHSRQSWEEAVRIHADIRRALGDDKGLIPILVLGLKSDLQTCETRVPRAEAESFAQHHGYLYAECSALTGDGVHEAFAMLVEQEYAATIGYVGDTTGLKANKRKRYRAFTRVIDTIQPRQSGLVPRLD